MMVRPLFIITILFLIVLTGCSQQVSTTTTTTIPQTVPHQSEWGIYGLTLSSEDVALIWSTNEAISHLCLNYAGDKFAFSMKTGTEEASEEIFIINTDGTGLTRLTNNSIRDLYPVFSPDGSRIAFLRMNATLDIYVMNVDGSAQALLYDSGGHDADPSWGSTDRLAFTRDSQISTVKSDGTDAQQLTDPPNAGQWGTANLPIGDYDPRYCPSASRVAFERMVDVSTPHGSYDLYIMNSSGTPETRLTTTGYSQGLVNWSHDSSQLVYIVAAIGSAGKYDIYRIMADGSNDGDITPAYFPANFLCHAAMFSLDDLIVYFTGQWYN